MLPGAFPCGSASTVRLATRRRGSYRGPTPPVPSATPPRPPPRVPTRRPPRLPRPGALAPTLGPLLALLASTAGAQAFDDAPPLPAREARVGVEYGRERWDRYWEGTLRRTNANIGTLTTEMAAATAAYGLTSRVTLVAALPYVRTRASAGVLHGMAGWQDLAVAARVALLETRVGTRATLGVTAVGGVAVPTSDYTPDFLPMSIGLGARRATARGGVRVHDRSGLFAAASAGHTWRSTVHLDRPAYYTDGRLVLSDEVAMPDVMDWSVSGGFARGRLAVPVALVGQRTLGGGDIRRQDMPFVSNRMDFTRVQARVVWSVPRAAGLAVHAGAARTLAGRNVGQATTLSTGLSVGVRP